MPAASSTIVGVDFGGPRRARDQRRKIIAIAARATDCTAILHAEGSCRAAIEGDPLLEETEGAVWVPSIACAQPA